MIQTTASENSHAGCKITVVFQSFGYIFYQLSGSVYSVIGPLYPIPQDFKLPFAPLFLNRIYKHIKHFSFIQLEEFKLQFL